MSFHGRLLAREVLILAKICFFYEIRAIFRKNIIKYT